MTWGQEMAMTNRGWALLPLRGVLGLVFLVHGGQKLLQFGISGTAAFLGSLGLPLTTVVAVGLIAVELLGGLALILGVGTRVAATLLGADMLGTLLMVHLRGGFFVPDGVEFVLTLLAGLVALAGLGPGPWSIDRTRAEAP
jgi:putative oxidoreductase